MSDPAKTLKIHECSVCHGSIQCRGDCGQPGRLICAVCAAKAAV